MMCISILFSLNHIQAVQYQILYSFWQTDHILYLSDCVTTAVARSHRPGLHSASTRNYVLPHLHTKFGERVFPYAGPCA